MSLYDYMTTPELMTYGGLYSVYNGVRKIIPIGSSFVLMGIESYSSFYTNNIVTRKWKEYDSSQIITDYYNRLNPTRSLINFLNYFFCTIKN